MYKLGQQFELDYNSAIAHVTNVVKGSNFRFTVINDVLIRLEYSEKGVFEDRPTQFAWHRNFGFNDFKLEEQNGVITITTKNFILKYLPLNEYKSFLRLFELKKPNIF